MKEELKNLIRQYLAITTAEGKEPTFADFINWLLK